MTVKIRDSKLCRRVQQLATVQVSWAISWPRRQHHGSEVEHTFGLLDIAPPVSVRSIIDGVIDTQRK
jgi:hypothetical protein